jgi:hypothetical protein
MSAAQKEEAQKQSVAAMTGAAPKLDIFDVTGHSLGIAVEGAKFHKIIEKESVIPVSMTHGPFTNGADFTTDLLVEVFQGEEAFVQANTRIGEVRISGLEPLPKGQQMLEVKFSLDVSGTLSTVCTDLRTKKTYAGSFTFDGITRMNADEIKKRRQAVAQMMAPGGVPAGAAPAATSDGSAPAIPDIPEDQIPKEWVVYWKEGQDCLKTVDGGKRPMLLKAMSEFGQAVLAKTPQLVEDKAFLLQDALLDVKS